MARVAVPNKKFVPDYVYAAMWYTVQEVARITVKEPKRVVHRDEVEHMFDEHLEYLKPNQTNQRKRLAI